MSHPLIPTNPNPTFSFLLLQSSNRRSSPNDRNKKGRPPSGPFAAPDHKQRENSQSKWPPDRTCQKAILVNLRLNRSYNASGVCAAWKLLTKSSCVSNFAVLDKYFR